MWLLQLFCSILATDSYLLLQHRLQSKFVLCASAVVKKQIVDRCWIFGSTFLLRLVGKMSNFVKFFVIPKILKFFYAIARGQFLELFSKICKTFSFFSFFFGCDYQNGQVFFGYSPKSLGQ